MYLQSFPEANTNLNKFIQKDSLDIQCTYIPPIAILHRPEQRINFSDVMDLFQSYQIFNTKEFRTNAINFDNKTCILPNYLDYVTVHDEKKCILKDGEDNGLVILASQNIVTIGVIDKFTANKKKFLNTMFLFDKLKNESYKQLFQ